MGSSQKGFLKVYNHSATNGGWLAWLIAVALFGFYLLLYLPSAPGKLAVFRIPDFISPLANAVGLESNWSLYGVLYTAAILIGGLFVLKKHGNNRYQRYRTLTIMFVQLVFAFTLPWVMKLFTGHEFYFTYLWPLKIEYFYPTTILEYPLPIILYSFIGSLILFPLLAFFLGKRFYCSWIF
jgi:ferredoxin-type protein NapH